MSQLLGLDSFQRYGLLVQLGCVLGVEFGVELGKGLGLELG